MRLSRAQNHLCAALRNYPTVPLPSVSQVGTLQGCCRFDCLHHCCTAITTCTVYCTAIPTYCPCCLELPIGLGPSLHPDLYLGVKGQGLFLLCDSLNSWSSPRFIGSVCYCSPIGFSPLIQTSHDTSKSLFQL